MYKLIEYLPQIEADKEEMQQIQSAIQYWIDYIETKEKSNISDRYIVTATEAGIEKYEQLLGITPFLDDTIEDRRSRILNKWNAKLPFNYKYLDSKLIETLGAGKHIIEIPEAYTLNIKLAISRQQYFQEVSDLIKKTIPANIDCYITVMWNTHGKYKTYTHSNMAAYTHYELKTKENV